MLFPFASWDAPAKCIGSYERELHDVIEVIIANDYQGVVNIGCAEGYYAVGLARRNDGMRVAAHDTSPDALDKCKVLAEANGVAERISFGGAVTHNVLEAACDGNVLVLADIEGGEEYLLDPDHVPSLAVTDMLVELHHVQVPSIRETFRRRFAETHDIVVISSTDRQDPERYPELAGLPKNLQLLALFERPVTMDWWYLRSRKVDGFRRSPSGTPVM